jgi:hypothetical protein
MEKIRRNRKEVENMKTQTKAKSKKAEIENIKNNKKEVINMEVKTTKNKTNEVKNMDKILDKKDIIKEFKELSEKEKIKLGKEADQWYIRIERNPKCRKQFFSKIKTNKRFAMMNLIIESELTQKQIFESKANINKIPSGIPLMCFIPKAEKIKGTSKKEKGMKKAAELFNSLENDTRNLTTIEYKHKAILKIGNENKGKIPENKITKKKGEGKIMKERRKKELKKIDEEEKRLRIIKNRYNYVKRITGITKDIGKNELGYPIVEVTYKRGNAKINNHHIKIPSEYENLMDEMKKCFYGNDEITIPMAVIGIRTNIIDVQPCKQEIQEMLEKQQREDESNAIDVPVIVFKKKVYALTSSVSEKISLNEDFRKKVLKNPKKMQGIWKMVPKKSNSNTEYVSLREIGEKPKKVFSEYEAGLKRIEKWGVHKEEFICEVKFNGKRAEYYPLPDKNSKEDDACYELKWDRIRLPKDLLKKIEREGEGQAWKMTFSALGRNDEKTGKRNIIVGKIDHMGSAEEYEEYLFGDE